MNMFAGRSGALCWLLLLPLLLLAGAVHAQDAGEAPAAEPVPETQVMHAFTQQALEGGDVFAVPDRTKHLIMFIMGASLLVFLIVTVVLGVAMALYGKRVFIPHMIFAGFSLTLAIVHSVVAVVWFFPFSSP